MNTIETANLKQTTKPGILASLGSSLGRLVRFAIPENEPRSSDPLSVEAILASKKFQQFHALEISQITKAVARELLDILQNGGHRNLIEDFRLEIGDPLPPQLRFEMMNRLKAEGLWDKIVEAQAKENLPRRDRLPIVLLPHFYTYIVNQMRFAIECSLVENQGSSATFRVSRDYEWHKPLPNMREFFRFSEALCGYSLFDFNRDFPEKFDLTVAYNGKRWSAFVRRVSPQPEARDPMPREIYPRQHRFVGDLAQR